MSKKPDPNIIRVGDRVKILTPNLFIRCGYPLGIQDMIKEIDQCFGTFIEDMLRSAGKGDKMVFRDQNGKYPDRPEDMIVFESEEKGRDYRDIARILAYERLKLKQYGGNTRSIHTETIDDLKGKVGKVIEIRFVHTGTYQRGYSGYSYEGEYDYEPSYLSDEQTHKILTLSNIVTPKHEDGEYMETPMLVSDLDLRHRLVEIEMEPIRIQALFVEKVRNPDEEYRVNNSIMEMSW